MLHESTYGQNKYLKDREVNKLKELIRQGCGKKETFMHYS